MFFLSSIVFRQVSESWHHTEAMLTHGSAPPARTALHPWLCSALTRLASPIAFSIILCLLFRWSKIKIIHTLRRRIGMADLLSSMYCTVLYVHVRICRPTLAHVENLWLAFLTYYQQRVSWVCLTFSSSRKLGAAPRGSGNQCCGCRCMGTESDPSSVPAGLTFTFARIVGFVLWPKIISKRFYSCFETILVDNNIMIAVCLLSVSGRKSPRVWYTGLWQLLL